MFLRVMINRAATRRRKTMSTTENKDEATTQSNASRSSSASHGATEEEGKDASLRSILNELRDFRRDNKQQLTEIKQEMSRTNSRLDEAEGRIDETETALQAAATLLKRLSQRQASMEAKLTDQEGRARRDNIRIYGISEDAEGNNMSGFLENLLRDSLDFPRDMELKIERAHRTLAPKPSGPQAKPRAIVVIFASYRVKEEVVRKAWQKKEIFHNNIRFYVDHDYPLTVLKRRMEYAEAKKILKEKKVKFQTPYPARLRVFYSDGACLYQNATEATEDMAARGFSVTIIPAATNPDQREMELLSTWQVAGERRTGTLSAAEAEPQQTRQSTRSRPQYIEKLQEFRSKR